MIRAIVDVTVMPQQTELTVVHAHFVYQPLAQEICLVFGKVHIVGVTERGVHDRERMKREWCQLERDRVDPSDSPTCLQTETGRVGKAHREIIGVACVGKTLHVVDGRA